MAILISLGFSLAAHAHLPEGKSFQAFQFPDNLLPVIDGQLDDWKLVDESYVIATAYFEDLVGEEGVDGNAGDFSVRLMTGWNEAQNQLFIAAQVFDDIHQVDRPPGTAAVRIFQDDAVEIFIDADHSGGQFADFRELSAEEQREANGSAASHFVVSAPPPDDDYFVNFSAASWYALADGPYTRAAYRLDELENGTTVMIYEVMVVPFDRVDVDAVFLSDEHHMREGEVIGFNVEFNDFDMLSELYDAKWSLSGGYNAYRFSERFTDLMLMPLEGIFHTKVDAITWGRIKSSFNRR